jgi:WD40 repeat protein
MCRLQGVKEAPQVVAFSPDGRSLAAGTSQGIQLWDIASGKVLQELSGYGLPRAYGPATGLAFAPDGRTIAGAGGDHVIHMWDVATGRERLPLPGPRGDIYVVAVSPDGKQVVTGGADKVLRVWDLSRGKERAAWDAHLTGIGNRKGILCAAITPDGSRVASGGADDVVRLWDLATGREIRCFGTAKNGMAYINRLAISPDGRTLAALHRPRPGATRVLRLWDLESGKLLRESPGTDPSGFDGLAFTADGRWLAAVMGGEAIQLYRVTTGEEVRRFKVKTKPTETARHLQSMALSADGRLRRRGARTALSSGKWRAGRRCGAGNRRPWCSAVPIPLP